MVEMFAHGETTVIKAIGPFTTCDTLHLDNEWERCEDASFKRQNYVSEEHGYRLLRTMYIGRYKNVTLEKMDATAG